MRLLADLLNFSETRDFREERVEHLKEFKMKVHHGSLDSLVVLFGVLSNLIMSNSLLFAHFLSIKRPAIGICAAVIALIHCSL